MKLETIDETLSAKAEILRLLPASYSWLIIRLIQLAETTDLTAEDRQEAALKLVLSMLNDIPVLNADGRLLAPLYELLDDHMNNPKNGGKPHRHGALQAAGMAYVEICKENGEAVGKAQEHVAKTMREAGWSIKPAGVEKWRTGKIDEQLRAKILWQKKLMALHVPIKVNADSLPAGRAKDLFDDLAQTFSRKER